MNINSWRLPFRNNTLFSILAFGVFVIPLAFTIKTYENFETVKFCLWMAVIGWALLVLSVSMFRDRPIEALDDGEPAERPPGGLILKMPFPKLFLLLLTAFWVWSLLSSVHAFDLLHSFFGFYYRFTNGFLFYSLWLLLMGLLLMTWKPEHYRFLINILFFDAFAISAFAIVQSLGVGYYEGLSPAGFLSAPSLLGNPNFSAMFIACLLPVGLALGVEGKNLGQKIYYSLGCFAIVCAVLVLSSRGAELALIVGLLVFAALLLKFKKFSRQYIIFLSLAFLSFVLLWYFSQAVVRSKVPDKSAAATTTVFTYDNVSTRFFAWDMSRLAILKHPLLGVGLGNFQIFFERNRSSQLAGAVGVFDDAHNLFLQLAATGGLPLALIFIGLIILALFNAWSRIEGDGIMLASAAGLVCWCLAASFTPVVIPCFLLLAVFLVGLAAYGCPIRNITFHWQKIQAVIGGVIGVGLFVFAISFLVAEHLFFVGYNNFFAGNYVKAKQLASWSIKLNPTNQLYYIYKAAANVSLRQPGVEDDVNKMISLHPGESRTYMSAGNIYFMEFQKTGAEADENLVVGSVIKALSFDPLYAERYSKLGFYYYQFGNLDLARTYVKMGLTISPDQFSAWMLLAKIYQLQNKGPQMLFALEKAYKLNSDNKQMQQVWQIAKTEPNIHKVPLYVAFGQDKLE